MIPENELPEIENTEDDFADEFDFVEAYDEALSMREELLGATHPDSIATKHNIAELYSAMGNEDASAKVRGDILESLSPGQTS